MAGDWIKFRTSLINDGRVKVSAKKMNLKGNAGSVSVLGGLVTLWSLADEHADDEGVLYGYDETDINEMVGIDGFAENLHEDWIDTQGDWIKLPEYQEHNGQTAKKRARTAKRVANHKANAPTNDKVTQEPLPTALPREEKRREEKNNIKPNVKANASTVKSSDIDLVLNFLNFKTGKNFQTKNPNDKLTANALKIKDRLKDGYTVQQCKTVIARKSNDWKDWDGASNAMNPITLFRKSNFEKYLGECVIDE